MIVSRLPLLRTFVNDGEHYAEGAPSTLSISDSSLVILAKACPQLTNLELRGCSFTGMGMEAIGACCSLLRELTIDSECLGLSDHGLTNLPAGLMPNLRLLDLEGVDNAHDELQHKEFSLGPKSRLSARSWLGAALRSVP
jgi:hypothetical protein